MSLERRLNSGFGTHEKRSFPLNRGFPSTNTKIMSTFFPGPNEPGENNFSFCPTVNESRGFVSCQMADNENNDDDDYQIKVHSQGDKVDTIIR